MTETARTPWRIAICGSASVGKTSLVEALSEALALPFLAEEMRSFLEENPVRFSQLPSHEAAAILFELWHERAAKERNAVAFIADNSVLDFIAYAIHYRCLTEALASVLLPEVLQLSASYDAIFVLPWGALPYIEDGIRTPHRHEQLGYQLVIEGLLRRYIQPTKLHFVPEQLTELSVRCQWVSSVLHRKAAVRSAGQGMVYLVGAGPGDPRLLTLRAWELIQTADVVAHDLLVSQSILSLAPARVELLPVGRRYGTEKKQYRLHPDVLDRARKGKTVVRLKCGDPLVFGRGGEEAEELAEAEIPFEIIPGISAALGAAAYTGIPLTHRCYASQLTLSTGHESAIGADAPLVSKSGEIGTTVFYMVRRRLEANLKRLIQSGYPPETPAAYIASATTSSQQVVVGTLENLAERINDVGAEVPAVVIAGNTVKLRDKIAWFEKKQLQGCRILVARARPGSSEIASQLRTLGAEVIEAPSISTAPLAEKSSLTNAITRLHEYDTLVFGCAPGVEFAWPEISLSGLSNEIPIVAIGEQAERALRSLEVSDVVSCPGSCEDALHSVVDFLKGRRALLITSNQGRSALLNQLSMVAAKVDTVAAYQVQYNFSALDADPAFDVVVVPSSSAARLVLSRQSTSLKRATFVTMGPLSATAARAQGAAKVVYPSHDDMESLIGCVIEQVADKQRTLAAILCADEYSYARIGG